MNISEACEVLNAVAADHGEPLLETVIYMNSNRRDFEPFEIQALDEFMRVGRAFFADVESV